MSRLLLAALGTLAIASACGKKKDNAGPGSGSTVKPGSGSAVGSGSTDTAPMEDNPTTAVVAKAFGGKKPAFPELSKDGSAAVVELDTPVGLSGVSTYSVAFFVTANGVPQLVTLVDAKLVQLLLHGMESGTRPTIDTDTMAKTAGAITKRLADEGFSSFEGSVDVPVSDKVTAGPLQLQITEAEGALTITVTDPKGTQIASETIKPTPMGKVGEIDCTSLPSPRKAWFDNTRKRVLLRIAWEAGPDQCDAPDDQYRLWAAP